MMQAHYRSILDFSNDAITAAEKGYNRLVEALEILEKITPATTSTVDVAGWKSKCYNAMNDDFNSPILVAELFSAVKMINSLKDGSGQISSEDLEILKNTFNTFFVDILGLETNKPAESASNDAALKAAMQLIIDLRATARADRNFATSDKIRDDLAKAGIQLSDGVDGTTFEIE